MASYINFTGTHSKFLNNPILVAGQTTRVQKKNRKYRQTRCTTLETTDPGHPLTQQQQRSRQLIVAVDDTPDSLYSCSWVVNEVYRHGDFIHLLHGFRIPTESVEGYPFGQKVILKEDNVDQGINPACIELLQKSDAEFQVQLFHELEIPSVSQAICDIGRDLEASMIVMCSHQKGFLQELLNGSHTNYCVHHCQSPVVVLHPPKGVQTNQQQIQGARKYAIAVDTSDASLELLNWAVKNLYREDDVFHLIHVVPDVMPHPDLIGGFETRLMDEPSLQFQMEYVKCVRQTLNKKFMPILEENNIKGDLTVISQIGINTYSSVGYLICQQCEELGAHTLVIRNHNKGPLQEFFMGSISTYCTHHFQNPVVVLH